MVMSPRTASLFQKFMDHGLLDKPDISLINFPKVPNTGAQDYAGYMLTHTSGDKKASKLFATSLASREDAEGEKASVLSKLFDTLSIPLYGVANVVDSIHDGMDPNKSFGENLGNELKGVGGAIAGTGARLLQIGPEDTLIDKVVPGYKQGLEDFANKNAPKITGEDILHKDLGVNNKFARYGGGFAADVLMDPLTYVGGLGIAKRAAQGADKVLDAKAAVGSDPVGGISQLFKKEQAVAGGLAKPEAKFGMPPVAEDAVQHNMIPQVNPGNVPHQNVGTPLMDVATEAAMSQPKTRGLARFQASPAFLKQQQILDTKIASDVERGIIDVPNPARTASQKMERAQKDWERAMLRMGEVVDKSGHTSLRSATQIVNDLASGKVPKNVIIAPRAAGANSQVARDIMDNVIDGLMGPKRMAGRFSKRNPVKEIMPGTQIAMFKKIMAEEPDFDRARAMLASAEDHGIALGVQPIWHNGQRVRLSEVMEATHLSGLAPSEVLRNFAMRDTKKMDPVVRAAVQGLSAQRSLNMAEVTSNLSKLAEQSKRNVLNYSPTVRPAMEKSIVDTATSQAVSMGMTNKEMDAIRDLVRNIIDVDKLPAERWIEHASDALHEAVRQQRVDPKIIGQFNKMVANAAGHTYENLGQKVTGAMTVDTFMNHFTTWWGRGELRNYAQDVFTWGERNAELRAKTMRSIAMTHTADEVKAAWRSAAGMEINEDERVLGLANVFKDYMQQVWKVNEHGIGLNNATTEALSVAEKSQMLMDDVNRHLKDMGDHFQFTNAKRTRNAMNEVRNYSQGTDWMKSWDRHMPTDPVTFMYNLDLAMERATKEYSFLDDFVGRYGSLTKDAEHDFEMPLARIKGYHVPEEVGKQMLRVMDDLHKKGWSPNSPVGRFYSKALRIWKTGVTIYLPSHHIRNAIGDTYLMWLAGHNDTRSFIWARRIMHSQRTRYKEAINSGNFQALQELTDPQSAERAAKWAMTQGRDVIINQNGTRLTADQLYVAAHRRGLLIDAYSYEDVFAQSPLGELSATNTGWKKVVRQPLGGKAHHVATAAAEYREHYIRLAHFTAAINKGLKKNKNLNQVLDAAAHEVRKWHPDGRDLTDTEKKVRQLIPFYSWLRKSTPLLAQSMLTRPGKNLAYPRGMVALQNSLGIQGTLADPYPDDQLFPEWMRGYGIGPIGDPESDNIIARWWGNIGKNMIDLNGKPYGYTIVNPSNPLIDFGQQFGGFGPKDTAAGIGESLTPFAKVPIDLTKNSDFTGAPITKDEGGQGVLHYLSKQVPFTSPIQRVTDIGDRQRDGKEPGFDKEALLNMLTAAGVHGSGPYIKGAEFEAKERARIQARKN